MQHAELRLIIYSVRLTARA